MKLICINIIPSNSRTAKLKTEKKNHEYHFSDGFSELTL